MAFLQAGHRCSDADLLELFLERRDEAAFEALLRRHAPMVLGVCRRVLRHTQDAEDACQATFLVLARKAASLRSRNLLGNWLYGIALRTALKARAMNHKRRAREREIGRRARPDMPADESCEELLARLDTEIARLPEKYRVPVVFCELQGKSRKEVATLLGLPEGTLSSRLAYARKLLARRLATTQALSGALLTEMLARHGSAAVPSSLVKAAARASVQILSGQVVRAGVVSAQVLVLTEGVMKAMFLSKLQGVGVVVLALALGAGGVTYHQALAQTGSGGGPSSPANTSRWGLNARTMADELEELRLEVAALRKGLEATRERVKVLEHRLDTQGQALEGSADKGGQPAAQVGSTRTETAPPGGSTGTVAQGMLETLAGSRVSGGISKGGGAGSTGLTLPKPGAPLPAGANIGQPNAQKGDGSPLMNLMYPHETLLSAAAALEAAVKAFRQHPGDKEAAQALDQALQALQEIRTQKTPSQPPKQ
jgi:RNA polymerase sigma factor (sigma-70 family)